MYFNYKRHAKFLIFFTFIAFISIWLFSVYCSFYRPIYAKAEYWIADKYNIAETLFENRDKNKKNIFIISGSNSIFGIHTSILENAFTEYNIHNFAVHAGSDISFYLNYVKQYAKKEDIIIAPLEYGYINRKNIDSYVWSYRQFSTWATKYRNLLNQELQREIFKQLLTTYWISLPNFFQKLPIKSQEEINDIIKNKIFCNNYHTNKWGEMLHDKPTHKKIQGNFKPNYPITSAMNQDFINEISQFNTYAQENNIKFYVTYPVSIKSEISSVNIDTEKSQQEFKEYKEKFTNLEVNFFGNPKFSNLELKYFFDTNYHLNATGAVLRSLLLAEDIKTSILGLPPSYTPETEDEFFKQKEQEALKYMEELRKAEQIK